MVVCEGFFEWEKQQLRPGTVSKQPYFFHPRESSVLTLAALWDSWRSPEGEEVCTFTIITVPAAEKLQWVHDRMPAILREEEIDTWLNGPVDEALALLGPKELVDCYPVSDKVNNVRNNTPECVQRIEAKSESKQKSGILSFFKPVVSSSSASSSSSSSSVHIKPEPQDNDADGGDSSLSAPTGPVVGAKRKIAEVGPDHSHPVQVKQEKVVVDGDDEDRSVQLTRNPPFKSAASSSSSSSPSSSPLRRGFLAPSPLSAVGSTLLANKRSAGAGGKDKGKQKATTSTTAPSKLSEEDIKAMEWLVEDVAREEEEGRGEGGEQADDGPANDNEGEEGEDGKEEEEAEEEEQAEKEEGEQVQDEVSAASAPKRARVEQQE